LEERFIFDINDNNGRYKLTNDFLQEDKFDYITECSKENGQLSASLSVLRLVDYRNNPIIRITMPDNHNAAIVEDNLIELLMMASKNLNKDLDFDNQHVFNIHYEVDLTAPMQYTITIDGWSVIKIPGGLGEDNYI
jgi:hypothetical protein